MRMMSEHKKTVAVLMVLLIGFFVWTLTAGNLNPPATPGSTMKTLDEVEARIPINSDTAPGDATYEHIISDSGSYYLTSNINTSKRAIEILADDVTIDFMGYHIIGPDSGYGIYMYERNNVEIRNGTIRDFNRCIYEAGVGKNHRLINLRVISNMDLGIYLNSTHNLVKDCVVSDNANLAIHTGNSSTITGNIVADNGKSATGIAVFGIRTGKGCFVTNNTVSNNGTSATLTGNVLGITTGDGCTVIGNTVYDNGRDADADVYGIVTGNGCAIIANTSYYNGYSATGDVYGISFSGYDLVDQNTAYSNGLTASGTATNMTQGVTGCAYGKNVAP